MTTSFASLDQYGAGANQGEHHVMSPAMLDGIRREWQRLGQAGTWWTGAERVAIAEVARKALAGADTTNFMLPLAATQAAAAVAANPVSISSDMLNQFEADGLSASAYTEIVGVVARMVAIDTAVRGTGGNEEPLPTPSSGEPSQIVPAKAKKRSAWVPMVGAAGAVTALSGVAAEDEAQRDLHGALYLSYEEMGDMEIVKGLTRAQLELVASRTSLINQCVY